MLSFYYDFNFDNYVQFVAMKLLHDIWSVGKAATRALWNNCQIIQGIILPFSQCKWLVLRTAAEWLPWHAHARQLYWFWHLRRSLGPDSSYGSKWSCIPHVHSKRNGTNGILIKKIHTVKRNHDHCIYLVQFCYKNLASFWINRIGNVQKCGERSFGRSWTTASLEVNRHATLYATEGVP